MAHPTWPLFDLTVRTPRLVLRYADDELAMELVRLAERGVHDPSFMPFSTPWTDESTERMGIASLQFHWRCRAELSVERWQLPLAVIVDGRVIGASDIATRQFSVRRWFETGSWLGQEFQARGFGTELRIATLHLGFVGFGALTAGTGAFHDNGPSLGVTRKLGYEPNGVEVHVRRGERSTIERYRMERAHFDAHVRRDDVELLGVEPVRTLLEI